MRWIFFILVLALDCKKTNDSLNKMFYFDLATKSTEFSISLPQDSTGKVYRFELTSIDVSRKGNPDYPTVLSPGVYLESHTIQAVSNIIKIKSNIEVAGKTVYLSGYENSDSNQELNDKEQSFGKYHSPIIISNYYESGYQPSWAKTTTFVINDIKRCTDAKYADQCRGATPIICSAFYGYDLKNDASTCNKSNMKFKSFINKSISQSNNISIELEMNSFVYGSCFMDLNCNNKFDEDACNPNSEITEPSFYWKPDANPELPALVDINQNGTLNPVPLFWYPSKKNAGGTLGDTCH